MELQSRLNDLKRQGLGLVAISYDSAETLKEFSVARGITFPLLADQGSAIIRLYGLLNTTVEPGSSTYGIPFPGTLIVDRQGIVRSRHFEQAYQERNTVASILVGLGRSPSGSQITAETPHLRLTAAVSDTVVAPGTRASIVVDVMPNRGMHVYAPGGHSYRVVRLTIDERPWARLHPLEYPASDIYYFAPLDERVEVYQKPFRLVQDVTILATREVQKLLAGMSTVVISGRVEYQACDDRVCYQPQSIPVSWTLNVRGLDRK